MRQLLALVLVLILPACEQGETAVPLENEVAAADVVRDYPTYQAMSEQYIPVDPRTYTLCRPALPSLDPAQTLGPHAERAVRVYMNEFGAEAFRKQARPYPVGSVIVKEKLTVDISDAPDGPGSPGVSSQTIEKPGEIAGMIKRKPGYDPANNDWEYFYAVNQRVTHAGRLDNCIDCHANASRTDYVFGNGLER